MMMMMMMMMTEIQRLFCCLSRLVSGEMDSTKITMNKRNFSQRLLTIEPLVLMLKC